MLQFIVFMSETVLAWALGHLGLVKPDQLLKTGQQAFAQEYRPSAHVVGCKRH
jgi:hypothetical protein